MLHDISGQSTQSLMTDLGLRRIFGEEYHECFITGFGKEGMRQLGNSVPVQLAYIVGKSVVGALKKS